MSRRRRLEAAESITGKPDLNPPVLMTDEDLLFWFGLLEQTLNARSAEATRAAALSSPAHPGSRTSPARSDEHKSEARREFDAMIFRIAERLKGAPPSPIPPLVLAYAPPAVESGAQGVAAATAENDLTASELLKVLRRKLGA